MIHEETIRIPIHNAIVPALLVQPSHPSRGTVLLYHGLGAAKEVQRKELFWLGEAGLRGLCIDAPHHGERNDGLLEWLENAENPHPDFIKIVLEATKEVPELVAHCKSVYGGGVAIAGISLGGFISFAAPMLAKDLVASIPILGSPDWAPRDWRKPTPELQSLMQQSPVRHPSAFAPCPVLAMNAGRDVLVPPGPARTFIDELRAHYAGKEDRVQYREFPESEHMMREEDWIKLWQEAISWLHRFF